MAGSVAAYEHPLSHSAIREAYFLGRRRDEKTAAFLAQYVRRLPIPKSGPHVTDIEIRTPYEQAVLRAALAPDGYSAQQAAQDYRAQSEVVVVRVRINLTPSYAARSSAGQRADFWRDFSIRLIQEHPIDPQKVSGKPIYSGRNSALVGADVELQYDATEVASAPARIEVLAPDGHLVETELDLSKLR